MAHSKKFMLEEIQRMATSMELALKHINSPEGALVLPEEASTIPVDVVREGYKWLVTIFDVRYHRWATVRALLAEDQWERYYLWGGFDNHREMVMLKEASLHLRQEIVSRTRPDLFKRGKINVIIKKQAKAAKQAKAGKPKKQPKASQRTKAAVATPDGADQADVPEGAR